jgi:hypothetical protein
MDVRPLVLTLAVAALVAACGVESSRGPTAPGGAAPAPPAPAPAPTPPAETWSGTFVSGNWPHSPFPITVKLARTADRITGTWHEVVWLEVGGSIEGTVDGTSFTGTVSVNDCSGPFRGTLTATEGLLASPGVSEGCGPIYGSVPNPVDIRLLLSK